LSLLTDSVTKLRTHERVAFSLLGQRDSLLFEPFDVGGGYVVFFEWEDCFWHSSPDFLMGLRLVGDLTG
jgi:hypothetical protein